MAEAPVKTPRRVLITGIAGFAGSILAQLLLAESGVEIYGVIHRHDWRIRAVRGHLHLHKGDLRNPSWVDELIREVQPDFLLHLAAWSDVGGSWSQPWVAYELNIHCQLNLLEAVRRFAPHCRVLVVGSNEVYGRVLPEDLPVDEETPFRPNSPYGVSKIAQDMMGYQYFCNYALPIVRVRSFNHIGPGQSDDFVASAFARQIAEIEAGQRQPVLQVGNLAAVRDFTDVRDVVVAYWLVAQLGEAGAVYNVGSGQGYSIQMVLDRLLGMSDMDIRVEQDPTRLRPSDVPSMICDNRRLLQATGWQPSLDLSHTLQNVLDAWRQDVRGNHPRFAGVSD